MLKLDKNKKYLLACSYGPDSMALFHMLKNEGYNFEVAHVNYHFREESDLEEEGLREYCNKNNVPIYVYSNPKEVVKNIEAVARDIRYRFFKDVYKQGHFDALLVAHHEDDNIETYLMQKDKNLQLFHYGIDEFTVIYGMQVIRPLLSYSKLDLLNVVDLYHVPYMIDKSNYDDSFLRNKYRNNIIKKLSIKDRYKILVEMDKKNEEIRRMLVKISKYDLHSVKVLSNLKENEFNYAILRLGNECQIFKISQVNINEIKKIILSDKPNVTLHYNGYDFVKEYDYCAFKRGVEEIAYSYVIYEGKVLDTPYFYLDFRGDTSTRNVKEEDYPITVRNVHKDDMVMVKDYQKDVKRLFIDWKMPMSLRKRWPVILNKDGKVIYVPRYRSDFKVTKDLNFYVK